MGYNVQQKAECVGTFRWIEIQLMELLARWVPTTPEMEVKVLFGRHVWDCAQHADMFGKRAFELRAQLHYTLAALPDFRSWLAGVAELVPTWDRVSAFYGIVCPVMDRHYRHYLAQTDPLMDEPTVRIIETVLRDYERMSKECDRLAGESLRIAPATDLPQWLTRSQGLVHVVVHSPDKRRARGVTV